MKTIAIIQARMSSSRLPGKITKKFSNHLNMIDMQLKTLQKVLPSSNIYIATTQNKADNIIEEKYQSIYNVYRGDEDDVLSRFLEISELSKADQIIRIASDNPFIFYEGIKYLLEQHIQTSSDYTTFTIKNKPSMLVPCGLYTEIITSKALREIDKHANSTEKEHVTYAIYTRLKEDYRVNLISITQLDPILNNKDLRFTVDTQEDFDLIDETISALSIKSAIDLQKVKRIIAHNKETNQLDHMKQESSKLKNSKSYDS